MANVDVWLRIYDLSDGKAAAVSPLLLRKPIRGVWHSSIEVYGYEYFYGGYIERMPPEMVEADIGLQPDVVKLIGSTSVRKKVFERFLRDIDHDFTPETYDLIEWNCNHFADVCSRFLLGGVGVPKALLCQPTEVARSIVGKALLGLLELAQSNPVQTGGRDECRQVQHKVSYRPKALQERVLLKKNTKITPIRSLAGAIIQAGIPSHSVDWKCCWPFNTCSGEVSERAMN